MITIVSFISYELGDYFRIEGEHKDNWVVRNFEEGIAEVIPGPGCPIDKFAETIVGCFAEGSNFEAMLQKIFHTGDKLEGIKGFFNGIELCLATKGATAEQVASRWYQWQALQCNS